MISKERADNTRLLHETITTILSIDKTCMRYIEMAGRAFCNTNIPDEFCPATTKQIGDLYKCLKVRERGLLRENNNIQPNEK